MLFLLVNIQQSHNLIKTELFFFPDYFVKLGQFPIFDFIIVLESSFQDVHHKLIAIQNSILPEDFLFPNIDIPHLPSLNQTVKR